MSESLLFVLISTSFILSWVAVGALASYLFDQAYLYYKGEKFFEPTTPSVFFGYFILFIPIFYAVKNLISFTCSWIWNNIGWEVVVVDISNFDALYSHECIKWSKTTSMKNFFKAYMVDSTKKFYLSNKDKEALTSFLAVDGWMNVCENKYSKFVRIKECIK